MQARFGNVAVRKGKAGSGVRHAVTGLSLAVVLTLAAGCTTLVNNVGYAPTDLQLQEVELGKDTQEVVAEKVGSPPLEDMRRDDVWYYVYSRYETWAWQAPKEISREVVAIRFSDSGTVTNIERYGLESGQVVVLSRRVTNPSVPDIGFLRGILSNTSLSPTGSTPTPSQ